jgi:iron complex transport system substrate-binding protein
MRVFIKVSLSLLLVLYSDFHASAATPKRIVSTHLCADQLVMLLAKEQHVVSLSYFASNPNFSALSDKAKGFHRNYGLVEEILPLNPDIVFSGGFSARSTVKLLKRAGINVVELPIVNDFSGIQKNIRIVAKAVGEKAAGEGLIKDIDLALKTSSSVYKPKVMASLYWDNGYTPGSSSLAAQVVRHAGFDDLNSRYKSKGPKYLSVEELVTLQPDLLILPENGPASLASIVPRHRALTVMFKDDRSTTIPDKLWTCGSPFIIEAFNKLRRIRENMK